MLTCTVDPSLRSHVSALSRCCDWGAVDPPVLKLSLKMKNTQAWHNQPHTAPRNCVDVTLGPRSDARLSSKGLLDVSNIALDHGTVGILCVSTACGLELVPM